MIDEYDGTGGVSIIPSARKSIHNHANCPFLHSNNMGRYGLNKTHKGDTHATAQNTQGFDVVDNVMSKPVKTSSPLQTHVNHKNAYRRQSLGTPNSDDSDDNSDADDTLAKSVPAILPSYCRGDFNYSAHSDRVNQTSHVSSSKQNRQKSYSFERERSIYHDRSFDSQSNQKSNNFQDKSKSQEATQKVSIFLLPLVGFLIYTVLAYCKEANMLNIFQGGSSIVYDELKFHTDINNLRRKYKVTDDTILQLQTGISTIYRRQDTGSFIFIYNSNSKNFDPAELNRFMHDVSTTSAHYLRNDSTSVQHITVQGTNLNMNTHNELIKKYRDDVDKSGVMLITEIDKVPSSLAMAFHYYCDEYNPLVKKSAIFFTLNLAQCSDIPSDQTSIHALIEKCLENKWYSGVPKVNMAPLLTRVVNIVIDVTSIEPRET
ncbi:uncharacterized protein LOC113522522 isoform X1 [Galleria mellonella]|uniref:Uncharacterized protein LOC113522522 isoform X1 n=1 Tax=Galleria mellonella TaxID=7137 RepID=A0A6J1X327_GALME|nr:uncharacterized protein LOC113522522 isoform X1 [Galleria mellonella]XP_052753744.1 uncharacterized protein LOC113522522 isoform X1 [Galleria mellonella]